MMDLMLVAVSMLPMLLASFALLLVFSIVVSYSCVMLLRCIGVVMHVVVRGVVDRVAVVADMFYCCYVL